MPYIQLHSFNVISMKSYKFRQYAIPTILLVIMLSLFNYLTLPSTKSVTWSAFDPIEVIHGTAFAVGFGLGLNAFLAYGIILLELAVIWLCLFGLVRWIWR